MVQHLYQATGNECAATTGRAAAGNPPVDTSSICRSDTAEVRDRRGVLQGCKRDSLWILRSLGVWN